MIDLAEKHISTYRPRITEVRSVFILIRYPSDKDQPIPSDLNDHRWREWIKCKPEQIESGHVTDLAVHQAFRRSWPRGFHRESLPFIELTALLYDPAVHRMRSGRLVELYSSTFRFHPR